MSDHHVQYTAGQPFAFTEAEEYFGELDFGKDDQVIVLLIPFACSWPV